MSKLSKKAYSIWLTTKALIITAGIVTVLVAAITGMLFIIPLVLLVLTMLFLYYFIKELLDS